MTAAAHRDGSNFQLSLPPQSCSYGKSQVFYPPIFFSSWGCCPCHPTLLMPLPTAFLEQLKIPCCCKTWQRLLCCANISLPSPELAGNCPTSGTAPGQLQAGQESRELLSLGAAQLLWEPGVNQSWEGEEWGGGRKRAESYPMLALLDSQILGATGAE